MEATLMKPVGHISTGVLLLLFGTVAPTYAHQEQEAKPPKQEQQAKPEKQQQAKDKQDQDQKKKKQQQERAKQQQQGQNKQQQQRVQQQQQQDQNRQQQERTQQQQRLSQQEQQQRIELQKRNEMLYRQNLDQQMRLAQQHNAQLQQQRRMAQYRFQQNYYERLRQQQIRLQNERGYNYNNDPYYYSGWTYRYNRGGSYYQTNQYGADLLRQAVNNGYQEGFRAGQADRQDRWRSNYQDSYAYQDANWGYGGRYVQQDEYNYYFREGFRRGYEDGYNSRYQYGGYSNGNYSILGNILSGILKLEPLR